MARWSKLAAELDPPVSDTKLDRFKTVLDSLEDQFHVLESRIPVDALIWARAEDAE